MWWLCSILFGFIILWGYEMRVRDLNVRADMAEIRIRELEDEVINLKRKIKVETEKDKEDGKND
ncbi:MAG: hypothetical protein ABH954_03415 [Candidatus Omnitrophota bacterium]